MNEICDPGRLNELITSDETWLYHFESARKAMNKTWVPKGEDAPQISKRCQSEKEDTLHNNFSLKWHCATETLKAGKSITVEYYRDCVLSELNKYHRKTRQPQACVESNFFMIMYPHASRSWYRNLICPKENIQTLPHFPSWFCRNTTCDFLLLCVCV